MRDSSPTRRRRPPKALTISQGDDDESPARPRRRRRRRRDRSQDTPFWLLMVQVGATIFVVCAFLSSLFQWIPFSQGDDEYVGDDQYVMVEEQEKIVTHKPRPTQAPLPVWTLGKASELDAYGLAETLQHDDDGFWKVAASLRNDFSERFGNENAARAILERGLSTFGERVDIEHTACRIRNAKEEGRSFKFSFGGYSVTVGRGNFFSQSFPFVMERILKRPFRVLGVELQVINAAVGGIPSFPYGWCMENFWGRDADVVSWDYSMNEAGGVPEGLEAYMRHAMMLDRVPKLIVKDTHMAEERRDLLQNYARNGLMVDSVVVHTDPAAAPFLDMKEESRPKGFKDWRKFGSPPGAPGQALHHPAVREHEFIAWILSMHFLSALEMVAADLSSQFLSCKQPSNDRLLPPPVSVHPSNLTMDWSSILYGAPTKKADDKWKLNQVKCRTSYEPILQGNLDSLIVSGISGNGTDIMLPKGAMYYSKGWVMDLSDEEKLAKRKLDRYNGLGYVDSKQAYYGIYASGPLRLFLPYEGDGVRLPRLGDCAMDWFHSIVFCQVNEKTDPSSCNFEKHISYTIGGVNATTSGKMIDSAGSLYYGKKLCLYIPVPSAAKLTTRHTIDLQEKQDNDDAVGLAIDISVSDMHIMKKSLACSISHFVWEEIQPAAP